MQLLENLKTDKFALKKKTKIQFNNQKPLLQNTTLVNSIKRHHFKQIWNN